LSSAGRVAIVPDGILQSLPFEILEMSDGRLLVETTSVHYLPSAAFLLGRHAEARWASRMPWSPGVNALGDPVAAKAPLQGSLEEWTPLPHSREEIRAIVDLLPGRKTLHLGPDARKEELPWTLEGIVSK